MYNKKFLNKFKIYAGVALCAIAVLASPVSATVVSAAGNDDIGVCTDFREWVYKIDGDKMYKALFNHTTAQFETDWIYVCDWPEGAT